MRVAVDFQDERVELEVPEGRLVADWRGPVGIPTADVPALVTEVLENPTGYPPLRQAVVPGDRVVIAFGGDVPEPAAVLASACALLAKAGVDAGSITVLADPDAHESMSGAVPPGVVF